MNTHDLIEQLKDIKTSPAQRQEFALLALRTLPKEMCAFLEQDENWKVRTMFYKYALPKNEESVKHVLEHEKSGRAKRKYILDFYSERKEDGANQAINALSSEIVERLFDEEDLRLKTCVLEYNHAWVNANLDKLSMAVVEEFKGLDFHESEPSAKEKEWLKLLKLANGFFFARKHKHSRDVDEKDFLSAIQDEVINGIPDLNDNWECWTNEIINELTTSFQVLKNKNLNRFFELSNHENRLRLLGGSRNFSFNEDNWVLVKDFDITERSALYANKGVKLKEEWVAKDLLGTETVEGRRAIVNLVSRKDLTFKTNEINHLKDMNDTTIVFMTVENFAEQLEWTRDGIAEFEKRWSKKLPSMVELLNSKMHLWTPKLEQDDLRASFDNKEEVKRKRTL